MCPTNKPPPAKLAVVFLLRLLLVNIMIVMLFLFAWLRRVLIVLIESCRSQVEPKGAAVAEESNRNNRGNVSIPQLSLPPLADRG